MWYKNENNQWFTGNKIEFPNGTVLENNHEESFDGWFWSETEPEEYLEWKEAQETFNIQL